MCTSESKMERTRNSIAILVSNLGLNCKVLLTKLLQAKSLAQFCDNFHGVEVSHMVQN